ncbi:Lipase 1 precursor [uncultured Flavonifractor sp.]|nr:Lipase 1 precursor [uncultured Flavonifractor sp.]
MPIVFLHGLGQKPEDWNPVVNRLAKGSQALCPNLYALERDGEDYPALYGAFEQYCDGLEGPLDLCGLSLGGVLALQYAAEHPERVSSLALIGARASMPGSLLAIQNLMFRLMPAENFRKIGMEKQAVIKLCASMAELDLRPVLEQITCPALVLCGEKDRANRRAAEELGRMLPNGEVRLIAEGGHEANKDAPEALSVLLTDFYRRHAAVQNT